MLDNLCYQAFDLGRFYDIREMSLNDSGEIPRFVTQSTQPVLIAPDGNHSASVPCEKQRSSPADAATGTGYYRNLTFHTLLACK
jgi:hypothetical protein